ncbi:YesL family protein [Halobacillus mangrovi]|nr:DUF624 domain-containing protein [Halobacillus mangrovi]
MFGINERTTSLMKNFTNMILLNLLWILCSLPILTIGPSTAAMTNVIRSWKIDQEDSVFRSYFNGFRRYAKSGWIGTLWLLGGLVLIIDVLLFFQISSSLKVFILSIAGMALILYLLTTTFLFPVLVHYETSGFKLIKKSFTHAFMDGSTSIGIVLLWTAAGTLIYIMPILTFLLVVPVFMVTFRFCLRSFDKVGVNV